MSDILKDADDYRKQAHMRAVAHELSAEYHRHRGVQIGAIAKVISAIVGSTVFVIVITRLGLDGKGTISVPSQGWAWLAYIGFALLSILAPVLTGLETYLNDPKQAEQHMDTSADYYHLRQRFGSFISRYEGANLMDANREDARKELDDIYNDMSENQKKSISLTADAKKDAAAQIASEGSSGLTSV